VADCASATRELKSKKNSIRNISEKDVVNVIKESVHGGFKM